MLLLISYIFWITIYMGHFRTVWKILIFDFLHFLTFFSIHQKTLPGKFWHFLDHRFKRYRISGFRSKLLQKWSKFKIFFFRNFCFFTYLFKLLLFRKKYKKLYKVFLYVIFEFENFNFVFETVCILTYSSIFLIIFYFKLRIHSSNFKTGLIVVQW